MKKLIYVLTLLLLSSASFSNDIDKNSNISPARIKIDFSTRNQPEGGECAGARGFCLIIGINPAGTVDNLVGVNGSGEIYLDGNNLILNITKDDGEEVDDPSTFFVYEDIELNSEINELLGVSSCVIKKGQYKISNGQYKYGSVRLNVVVE